MYIICTCIYDTCICLAVYIVVGVYIHTCIYHYYGICIYHKQYLPFWSNYLELWIFPSSVLTAYIHYIVIISYFQHQITVKTEPMDTSHHAPGTSGPSLVKSLSLKIPTTHLKRPLPLASSERSEYHSRTPSPESVLSRAPSEGSLSPYPSKHKKRRTEHKQKKKNRHKEHKHKHKHRS